MRYSVSVLFIPEYVLSKQYTKDLPVDVFAGAIFDAGFSEVSLKSRSLTSLTVSVECESLAGVTGKM